MFQNDSSRRLMRAADESRWRYTDLPTLVARGEYRKTRKELRAVSARDVSAPFRVIIKELRSMKKEQVLA